MSKFITRSTYWFFAFIAGFIFVSKIYLFLFDGRVFGIVSVPERLVFISLLTGLIIAGFFALKRLKPRLKKWAQRRSALRLALYIFGISFVVRIVTVAVLDCDFAALEDLSAPHRFLSQLLERGYIYKDSDYAAMYTRYVNLTLFCYPWGALFGAGYISLGCYFSLLYSLSYAAWFCVIKRYTDKTIAFYGVVAFSMLLPEICLACLQLHETVLYFGITAFAWVLFDGLPRCKKAALKTALLFAGALALGIGTACNPMGYVAFIAFALYGLARFFKTKQKKLYLLKFAVALLLIFCTVISVVAAISAVSDSVIELQSSSERRSGKVPYGWSLYVGANYESFGKWNRADYEAYYPSADRVPDDKLYDHQLSLIKKRLAWYNEKPTRYVKHLFNKVTNTYGHYKEGISRIYYYGDVGPNKRFTHYAFSGYHYIGIFMQALLLLSFSRKKQDEVNAALFLKMIVCGVFTVLLFIEIMPKYVFYLWALMFWITLMDYKQIRQNPLLKKMKTKK